MSDLLAFSLVFLLTLPLSCKSMQGIEALQNQEYVDLPAGLCKGYSEILLGKVADREYVGLICEGDVRSYLLLQRIVGYTHQGKAIVKAVVIQPLPPLQADEFSVNAGCVAVNHRAAAIFAIVRDSDKSSYDVVKAWEANLSIEQFDELNPRDVTCSPPY
jgi:hypothetical protein